MHNFVRLTEKHEQQQQQQTATDRQTEREETVADRTVMMAMEGSPTLGTRFKCRSRNLENLDEILYL